MGTSLSDCGGSGVRVLKVTHKPQSFSQKKKKKIYNFVDRLACSSHENMERQENHKLQIHQVFHACILFDSNRHLRRKGKEIKENN